MNNIKVHLEAMPAFAKSKLYVWDDKKFYTYGAEGIVAHDKPDLPVEMENDYFMIGPD